MQIGHDLLVGFEDLPREPHAPQGSSTYDADVGADLDADALIADLDPDQRAAVTADSHLVAVVAGAGSGKTRVLTRRIAHRIATGDADARHTVALTFTREAAGELRRRLHRLGVRDHVEAGTFHAVMLRVLRQRWADEERRPKSLATDRRRLLREAQRDDGLAGGPAMVESAHAEISWAMARGIDVERYVPAARRAGRRPAGGVDQIEAVYRSYVRIKQRRGVIDFDDVLLDVLAAARRDADFAEGLRWRFRHVLVDEAQDLNPIQHRVVDLLRTGRDDLYLVGDPAQAVYGFNGADPSLLREVDDRFPGIEVIRLPVNHRCSPQIVAVGSHVLRTGGQPHLIRSGRDDGPAVTLSVDDDERAEAESVARRIARGDPNLVRAGEVAVLARTNAQLTEFESALERRGVAVRRSTTGSPLESAVRDAASNPTPGGLRAWAHDTLDDIGALESARSRLDRLGEPASGRRDVSNRDRTPHVSQIREATDAVRLVEAERRVAGAILDFLRDQPRGDGAEFRSWVATTNPFADRSAEGVELLTFHAAKGREWHTVFVTGLETGLMPHKSATTDAARAEEVRLLYVAATRASDSLVLTRAERRGGYRRAPSPYLEGLDLDEPELVGPPQALRRSGTVDPTLDRLTQWRSDWARRARVVPAQLLSDRDLSAIAEAKPATAAELDEITSIGPLTARRLAPEILPLVRDS
jgi:DNA helicase-2/ATP-dependent DNA helicase PcrA